MVCVGVFVGQAPMQPGLGTGFLVLGAGVDGRREVGRGGGFVAAVAPVSVTVPVILLWILQWY